MDTAPDFIPDEQDPQGPTPQPAPTPSPDQAPDFIPDEHPTAAVQNAPDFISHKDMDKAEQDRTTPGEQALTIGENFVKGLAPGIGQYAENKLSQIGVPDLSLDEQLSRSQSNPWEAKLSKLGGNTALMMLAPEIGGAAKLGSIGSGALNGAVQMGLIQGGDEVSKYLLGQGDSGKAAAWNIALASLGGAGGGAIFKGLGPVGSATAKKFGFLPEKTNSLVSSFLTGAGHALQFPEAEVTPLERSALIEGERQLVDPAMFKIGQRSIKNAVPISVALASSHFLPAASPGAGLAERVLAKEGTKYLQGYLAKYFPKGLSEKASAAFINAAKSGHVENIDQILGCAVNMARGEGLINNGAKALFNEAPQTYLEYTAEEREKERLKEQIEQDQDSKENGYADGGVVKDKSDPMASLYPELSMRMGMTAGKVKGYLKSLRPSDQNNQSLFDGKHRNQEQEREYDKAVALAAKPLSILKHIKNGTLTPKNLNHFNSMYPELHQELSAKIYEQAIKNRLKNNPKPPYKTRQAMSLFLGNNLDSSLSPQSIQAAQAVFIIQKNQNQSAVKESALQKSGSNIMTAEQARTRDLNKS